jgi:hypothetical protein
MDLRRVLNDLGQVVGNLRSYIAGFSPAARDIMLKFEVDTQIARLDRANLLYLVVSKFVGLDLHPETVSNPDRDTRTRSLSAGSRNSPTRRPASTSHPGNCSR